MIGSFLLPATNTDTRIDEVQDRTRGQGLDGESRIVSDVEHTFRVQRNGLRIIVIADVE
jgi:hypothetical protein